MKRYQATAGLTLALLVAGCLFPTAARAKGNEDSAKIADLLADAKTEAYQLRIDAEHMDVLARSGVSWESHAKQIMQIREHINQAGKLLAQLHAVKGTGWSWQQMAIDRIDPLLRELAANTEKTISHFNESQGNVHFAEFKEYVHDNYDLAVQLESLIRDFVDYGKAKETFERLAEDKEVTN